ncbi:MT-A70 family methyltransferase [Bradyrhizobium erythrophlei]|uniref:N6-adenosine-specific RNA methylase IME4 n=1 Tax=Bradyrhizobium erythrophlei TaxID=1437360 RepID=A0A1M5YIM9_9BRAD|nr:MT-A70 family methyltransferase [Bradyrhizobium erythrophlei]SHI11911.1 N6-adenosine-specific RNA methylase IME4 [Bradyrhizobium erythrophlei]
MLLRSAINTTAVSFFDPLVARSYDVVVIDPPWPFKTRSPKGQGKSASMHYRVMTLTEIMELPVRELLKDDAVVYLWTTGPLLDEAIATLKAWGITYAAHFAWRKVSCNGKMQWGTGYWARSCHETILLGTVGKPPCFGLPSCFDGVRREHSRKPDEFYNMIEKKTPGLRRADVFAREKREGWDSWGDEVEKFSSVTGRANHDPILDCETQNALAAAP